MIPYELYRLLQCPTCNSRELIVDAGGVHCTSCATEYPRHEHYLDLMPRRMEFGDRAFDYLPPHTADQMKVEPIYEEMKGWQGTTAGARSWADLPAQAIKYVRRIEELTRCPVALVSTSPERDDTILVRDPFAS